MFYGINHNYEDIVGGIEFSSLAPIIIMLLIAGLPSVYILMRVCVTDAKFNSLLLIGLSVVSSEVVVSAWLLGFSFQDVEILPTRLLAGASLAILVVIIMDLYITLKSMREQ
ncbi:MAG: hypothetical protein ACFFEF_02990 [Candidatus Thorarchaeota archaeon]